MLPLLLLALLAAPTGAGSSADTAAVTIDNRRPRTLRGSGATLNGHDGSVRWWNGSYIYHALAYDNCTEQAEGCTSHCATCCGYTLHHRVSVFTSPNLAQHSWVLAASDVVPVPVGPAPAGRGVIFRPKAVHSPRTGRWHLFWANDLATASSASPLGVSGSRCLRVPTGSEASCAACCTALRIPRPHQHDGGPGWGL